MGINYGVNGMPVPLAGMNSASSVNNNRGFSGGIISQMNPVASAHNYSIPASAPVAPDDSLLGKLDNATDASLITALQSAYNLEMAASASQVQAQKDLIDYSNEFSAEQAALNRLFQQNSADKAMKFSAAEAQKNRDYQTEMSNTAYQRAVADLQAAGLNPILAYTQGGASSPAGSTGSAYQASGSSASSASGTASKANASSAKSADLEVIKLVANTASDLLSGIIKAVGFLV